LAIKAYPKTIMIGCLLEAFFRASTANLIGHSLLLVVTIAISNYQLE
jgi:hypothetical protein